MATSRLVHSHFRLVLETKLELLLATLCPCEPSSTPASSGVVNPSGFSAVGSRSAVLHQEKLSNAGEQTQRVNRIFIGRALSDLAAAGTVIQAKF